MFVVNSTNLSISLDNLIAWFQLYAPGLIERNCPGAPKLNPAAPRFGVCGLFEVH